MAHYIKDRGFRNWLIGFNPPRKLKKRLKREIIYFLALPIEKRKEIAAKWKKK